MKKFFLRWGSAWAMLAEALAAVLSLGLWWTWWHMDYLVWKVGIEMRDWERRREALHR